jgi:ribonuclease Z
MTSAKRLLVVASVTFTVVMVYLMGNSDGRAGRTLGFAEAAFAAESPPKVSPVKARPRDTYYPNSEDLAEDEMRVIACGTGMPTTRAAQAAACFLVELGNGDKFIFDIGAGAAERLSSLQIPYDYLDKIFIGHLHADHFGSLAEMFIGGALMGRQKPLRVWGPSGSTPELGTAYAVEKMQEMYTWDLAGRVGLVDFRGYSIEVNEFDYKAENAVIYEDNGVKIRSFPAIHALDGPVSFSLEWNGLSVSWPLPIWSRRCGSHRKRLCWSVLRCIPPRKPSER